MTKTRLIDSPTFARQWREYQKLRHEHPEMYGLKSTGIRSLDMLLDGGLEPGQYMLIGGPPKGGKTTLMACIAKAFGKQQINFGWFGAEMNTLQTGSMIYSNVTGIERSKIRGIQLGPMDWDMIEAAETEIAGWSGYWNYGFSTINDIDDAIGTLEKETGVFLDAIMVDYVQLMEAPNIRGGRVEQLNYISRHLKRRSIEAMRPRIIIAAAQLRRENVRSHVFDMASWLGSGSFERDMDIGAVIHDVRDPATNTVAENIKQIELIGSRETGIGSTTVLYNGKLARIKDMIVSNSVEML